MTGGFSAPLNDQMVGHLTISAGSAPRVEEIWIIRPESGSVLVRQKHFTPDLNEREERNQWTTHALIALDKHHIYLENLTWLTEKDSLSLKIRIPGANGAEPQLLSWSMNRVK